MRARLLKRESYIILLTLITWITIAAMNRNFAEPGYVLDIIGNNSVYFLCALGVLPLMIMGGFDLSVSGIILGTSLAVTLLQSYMMLTGFAVLIISIVIGMLLGVLNGYIIGKLKVSSVIVTLAMASIYRGVSKYWFLVHGETTEPLRGMGFFSSTYAGLEIRNIVIIIASMIAYILVHYDRMGRSIFAFGGNPKLAEQAGFDMLKTTVFVYGFSGASAGLAAAMHMLMMANTSIDAYSGLDFILIIIVIIGGLNILGGYGTVLGTVFAAGFYVILKNGLIFTRIPAFWYDVVIGLIIVSTISYDMVKRKLKLRNFRRLER